ncbi:MAG: methanogenesis marker 8 protein [Euryarchaeota archaeon]|nr:methanogenesis marker 8 protein [Euryarchaeota archaeon]
MPHIMEMLGTTRVTVADGRVIDVGKPCIRWCPLFDKFHDIREITEDAVRTNMEFRIRELGMFTPERNLDVDVFVNFGASEVMMTGLKKRLIDTTVTACDGAGTVITDNPKLVQGMGAQISGLIETEPISEIIDGIRERGGIVIDPRRASIDPAAGVCRAVELGYKRIAVTVIDPATALKIREIESEPGVSAIIIAAHITALSRSEVHDLLDSVDIITGCASTHVRNLVKPLAQVGTAIPLFALTQAGKELVIERTKEITTPVLINTMPLPVLPEHKQPTWIEL